MIIKDLVQIGNPNLRKKSKPIKRVNSKLTKQIIKNLVDSMRFHELVGIAASQIGAKYRVFVTEIRKTKFRDPKEIDQLRIFINPQIVWTSKRQITMYEGCGGVAYGKLFGPVKRPASIMIEAINDKGEKITLKAAGLLARAIQHEYDHLEGMEFAEKITDIKKIMSLGEYLKRRKKTKS